MTTSVLEAPPIQPIINNDEATTSGQVAIADGNEITWIEGGLKALRQWRLEEDITSIRGRLKRSTEGHQWYIRTSRLNHAWTMQESEMLAQYEADEAAAAEKTAYDAEQAAKLQDPDVISRGDQIHHDYQGWWVNIPGARALHGLYRLRKLCGKTGLALFFR